MLSWPRKTFMSTSIPRVASFFRCFSSLLGGTQISKPGEPGNLPRPSRLMGLVRCCAGRAHIQPFLGRSSNCEAGCLFRVGLGKFRNEAYTQVVSPEVEEKMLSQALLCMIKPSTPAFDFLLSCPCHSYLVCGYASTPNSPLVSRSTA